MKQYRFALTDPARPEEPIPFRQAYPLYAWLLSQIPKDLGDALHGQGETPLSHYLSYDPQEKQTVWTISLFNGALAQAAAPRLTGLDTVSLRWAAYGARLLNCRDIPAAQDLMAQAQRAGDSRRAALRLLSPTSFRQKGRYVIFPQERLIVQSLIGKWNLVYPEYPLDDEDALRALEQGIRITDYRLRTHRYAVKGAKIPSFSGSLTLESRLPAPLEEIWKLLLLFAPYCGLGIKTALGMGGTSIAPTEAQE